MKITDRLQTAYLDRVLPRDRIGSPDRAAEEGIGYDQRAAILKKLVHRVLDAALEAEVDPVGFKERIDHWADVELARSLGLSTVRLGAFVEAEAGRLINLGRLAELFKSDQSLALSESVAATKDDRPLLAGESGPFRELLDNLALVADNRYSVLITGPTGTGKEMIARRIHQLSPMVRGPFLPVDCAALPENLIESELFGHEQGAFTGAVRARPGKVELAAGGTLFLDEIGELPVFLQVKLLRFLQERVVQRLGGGPMRPVEVRVIAATSRDLERMMDRGEFRSDLYYRLAALPISVPPLKDRPRDIPVLLDHYLTRACLETRKPRVLSQAATDLFLAYDYPGNVREMINFINHSVAVSTRREIDAADLPEPVLAKLTRSEPAYAAWLGRLADLGFDPQRRRVVAGLLAENQGGYLINSDLRTRLNCSDSTVRNIFNRLAQANLVRPEGARRGRRYRVDSSGGLEKNSKEKK